MRVPLRNLPAFIACWCGLLQAAAPQPQAQHKSWYAELDKVPPREAARQNPLAGDRTAVLAGHKLFADRCAQCHGSDAAGTRKAPNLRVPAIRGASPGTLFWILTNGVVRRGMPPWSKLPEAQRWQLVTYLGTLDE